MSNNQEGSKSVPHDKPITLVYQPPLSQLGYAPERLGLGRDVIKKIKRGRRMIAGR